MLRFLVTSEGDRGAGGCVPSTPASTHSPHLLTRVGGKYSSTLGVKYSKYSSLYTQPTFANKGRSEGVKV